MKIETMYATVIAAETQNFSTTHVYSKKNAFSFLSINSLITDHQVDHIWVKNHTLGREEKLSFQDERVDARAGHRLVLVRAYVKGGDYEARVYNMDTGCSYKTFLGQGLNFGFWLYFASAFPLIALGMLIGSYHAIKYSCLFNVKNRLCLSVFYIIQMLIVVFGYFFILMYLSKFFGNAISFFVFGPVYVYVVHWWYLKDIKTSINYLDNALSNAISVAQKDSSVFGS